MRKSTIVTTQTPFRVNFFGGGTDLPGYFANNKGAVLGMTVNKYSYVAINSLERLLDKKIRLSYSKLEMVDEPEEIQHDIVRAVLTEHKHMLGNAFLDIHSYADLPSGTGIGSSSAFAVGFLNAFYLLNDLYRRPRDLAREAIRIEREVLAEAGGWQDQIHVAHGGINRIDFFGDDFSVSPVFLPAEKQRALEDSFLFCFTGATRSSSEMHREIENQSESEKLQRKNDYLRQIFAQVDEGYDILVNETNMTSLVSEFGRLLDRGWQLKRSLSDKVSNSTLDEIYDVALKNGALGGKLLGAGGGGFFLFVVAPENRSAVRNALSALKMLDLKIERRGSHIMFSN